MLEWADHCHGPRGSSGAKRVTGRNAQDFKFKAMPDLSEEAGQETCRHACRCTLLTDTIPCDASQSAGILGRVTS